MTNSPHGKPLFDLEERTAKFGEDIIDFCQSIPENTITKPLIGQLIRSAGSIGANYCEADEAGSKKDFTNKLTIAKKEAKETKLWLRLIAHAVPTMKEQARLLWKETNEINLIFASIIRKTQANSHQ